MKRLACPSVIFVMEWMKRAIAIVVLLGTGMAADLSPQAAALGAPLRIRGGEQDYRALEGWVFEPGLSRVERRQRVDEASAILGDGAAERWADPFIERLGREAPESSWAWLAAGRCYDDLRGRGTMRDGAFVREEGSGWNCVEADRARARRCFLRAIETAADADQRAAAQIALARSFDFTSTASILALTDLGRIPEPTRDWPRSNWDECLVDGRTPWVGSDGRFSPPALPARFEDARSDLERVHRLLHEAGQSPARGAEARLELAETWRELLGVGHLARAGYVYLDGSESSEEPDAPGPLELHTLGEHETLVIGPDGPERRGLPEAYRFIPILKSLVDDPQAPRWVADHALGVLLEVFADRFQYDEGERWARRLIDDERFEDTARYFLDDIGPRMEFRGKRHFVEGRPVRVRVMSREMSEQAFELWRLDIDTYLERESYPRFDRWGGGSADAGDFDRLRRYFRRVGRWTRPLARRPNHLQGISEVEVPVDGAGVYLLTARSGDEWRVFPLYVNRSIAISPAPSTEWDRFGEENESANVFLADARTGLPVEGAEVLCLESGASAVSDAQGFLPGLEGGEGLLVRRPGQGDELLWFDPPRGRAECPSEVHSFFVCNQPVYRPGQRVDYAGWLKRTWDRSIRPRGIEEDAEVRIRVTDPAGLLLHEKELPLDEFDGFEGSFRLPQDIVLGNCRVDLALHEDSNDEDGDDPFAIAGPSLPRDQWNWENVHRNSWGRGGWRIEVAEFRKPDFRVEVEASPRPDGVAAEVRAAYHSGEPVRGAVVRARLRACLTCALRFPEREWDFLYDPGYEWPLPAPTDLRGWSTWGVMSGEELWRMDLERGRDIVVEAAGETDAEGRASLSFPVELPRLGEYAYDCEVSAVVQEFTGRGVGAETSFLRTGHDHEALAQPEKGFYRTGEIVRVTVTTTDPTGDPVAGQGMFTVAEIQPGPRFRTLRRQPVATDATGRATLEFPAPEPGRYRCLLESGGGQRGFVLEVPGEGAPRGEYDGIQLLPSRTVARPGDEVEVLVRTEADEATVWWFERTPDGRRRTPRVIRTRKQTAIVTVHPSRLSMPASYFQVATVLEGSLRTATCRIAVPPEESVLRLKLAPSATEVEPGTRESIDIAVTDYQGIPARASLAVAAFDRSLEQVSGPLEKVGEEMLAPFDDIEPIESSQDEDDGRRQPFEEFWQIGCFMERYGVGGEGRRGAASRFERLGDSLWIEYEPPELPNSVGGGFQARPTVGFPVTPATPAAAWPARGSATRLEPADQGALSDITVRRHHADRAFWGARILADEAGRARVEFPLPDNLTEWRVQSWAVGKGLRFGDAELGIQVRKPLQLRPLLPRAATVGDRLKVGAMVQNLSDAAGEFQVTMEAAGSEPSPQSIRLEAGGEGRVEWPLEAAEAGTLAVRFRARSTDGRLSDAVEERVPVAAHRVPVTAAATVQAVEDETRLELKFGEPVQGAPVEVRLEAHLASGALRVLPDLVGHPYGCTEQTLNRFLPTLIAWRSARAMGIEWEGVQRLLRDEPSTLAWVRGRARPGRQAAELSEERVCQMIHSGLHRLGELQGANGAWGWFSADDDTHSAYLTAMALRGFLLAKAEGITPDAGPPEHARRFLEGWTGPRAKLLEDHPERVEALDAWVAYVLCESGSEAGAAFRQSIDPARMHLPAVGLIHLAMTLDPREERERLESLTGEIRKRLAVESRQRPGLEWWRNSIETRAWFLKLLARGGAPSAELESGCRELLAERSDGIHWRSTRESALCLEAILEAAIAGGLELTGEPVAVTVELDGESRELRLDADNLWSERLVFDASGPARHEAGVTIRRAAGAGITATASASFDSSADERMAATDSGIRVERSYFRVGVDGSRTELGPDPVVKVGEVIEIELRLSPDHGLPFVHLVDPLPAGFEPVIQNSGYQDGAYRESRTGECGFFFSEISPWNAVQRHTVRAVTRGLSHALPARAECMYAPETAGRSERVKVRVE